MTNRHWISPDQFNRSGPGRSFEFEVSTGDLVAILERWGADHSPPWEVLTFGFEPIPGGRSGTWRVTAHSLSDLPALTRAGECYFFLRSLTISPNVDWTLADNPCALCSVNGLIGLQHPEPVLRRVSILGIVWKVVDHETGEVVVHDAYLSAYNAIKRQVKRRRDM